MLVLFIGYTFLLVLLSGLKSAGLFLHQIHALELFLGGDKWMHLLLAVPLSFLANLAAERVMKLSFIARIILVLAVLVFGLMVDELHQQFFASRRFDWMDSVWGSTGLLVGLAGYLLFSLGRKYWFKANEGVKVR